VVAHRYSHASRRVLPGVLGVLTWVSSEDSHGGTLGAHREHAKHPTHALCEYVHSLCCESSRTILRVLSGVLRVLTAALGALTAAAVCGEPRILRRERRQRRDELRVRRREVRVVRREGSRRRSAPVLSSHGVPVSTHREGLPRSPQWGSHAGCSEYSRLGRARRLGLERRAGRLDSCTARARSCVSGNGRLRVDTQPYLCMHVHT
jgi:hypothetical protein